MDTTSDPTTVTAVNFGVLQSAGVYTVVPGIYIAPCLPNTLLLYELSSRELEYGRAHRIHKVLTDR